MCIACQKCSWTQDYFWSDEYHPFNNETFLSIKGMFELAVISPDTRVLNPKDNGKNIGSIDVFLHTACELKYMAELIEHMYWYTLEDFENDKDKKCPNCGCSQLLFDEVGSM